MVLIELNFLQILEMNSNVGPEKVHIHTAMESD